MKVKEESEKAGLKLKFQKIKITVSGPSTSWQIEERKMKAVTDFLSLGNWKILKRDGSTKLPYLSPEKPVYESRSNS